MMKNNSVKKAAFLFLFSAVCAVNILAAADTAIGFETLLKSFGLFRDPNAGLTSFRSLYIPIGGRSEAMGSAFTAMSDDASFFEYNPAASSVLNQTETAFFHNFWIADSAVDTLLFTTRTKNLGYGCALKSFYIPFTEYTIFGERASTGYYSETTAMLNVSYNFFAGYTFKGLAVGGNLKTSFRSVPDYSENVSGKILKKSGLSQSGLALIADAGILMRFNLAKFFTSREPNFNIGAAVHNVGYAWTGFGKKTTTDNPPPSYASAGITYRLIKPLILAFEFQYPFNMYRPSKAELPSGSVGAEFRFTDFFAVQSGFLLRGGNPKISLGSSFNWKSMIFNVSYSFDLTSSAAPLNRISLGAKLQLGDGGRAVLEKRIENLYAEGLRLYAQDELEKAVETWQEVLEMSPGFDPAKKGIKAAKKTLNLRREIRDIQKLN